VTEEKDDHLRKAVLFNKQGNYEYVLTLDYSFQTAEDFAHWDLRQQAIRALKHATDSGTSGVAFLRVPEGWTMVALEPRGQNSYPVMVRGGLTGLADQLFAHREA
jgi:hypothetical protein